MNLKNKTSRIYQEKNFYDRFLKIKKIIKKSIPISIGIFLFIVFFWPSFFSQNTFNNLKKSTNPNINYNKDTSSENFNFQGIDEFDQPFYLQAKEYQIIENEKNKFFFIKPKAEINLKEGKWVTLVAKKGIFDLEKKTLELIDNVLVLHSDGQQISTDTAIIDMTKGEFYGSRDLFGTSDKIKFNSEGFNVEKETGKISLFGKSKIKIKTK